MNKLTLVENWRKVVRHSGVIKLALAGIFGPEVLHFLFKLVSPEVLQLVVDNLHLMPWLPDDWKDFIRLLVLAAIPVVRILMQKSLSGATSSAAS